MNILTFNKSLLIYELFKNKLENSYNFNSDNCYLIEDSWKKALEDNFNEYKISKYLIDENNFNTIINFPKKDPDFINDIPELINVLKNNKKISLISKEMMEVIFNKTYLNQFNYVKYIGKNNKYIIEFVGNNDNKGFLIFNNFNNSITLNSKIFIIINNESRTDLYLKLLSLNNNDITNQIEQNENIIPFEVYINFSNSSFNKQINLNISNMKDNFCKEILKLIIFIFYYEKNLSENLENIFSDENEEYYLINPVWLNQFKIFSDYQKIYQFLDNIPNDNDINYQNIYHVLETLTESLLKEIKSKFKKNNLFEKLKDINILICPIDNKFGINFFSKCIIIPSNIFNRFRNIFFQNEEIPNMPIKIISKEKNIFVLFNNDIEIGNLNTQLIFIPKYFFILIQMLDLI